MKTQIEYSPDGETEVKVDGYSIPRLTARLHTSEDDSNTSVHFVLDRRFGLVLNQTDGESVLWFMAQQSAIARGLSHASGETEKLLDL